MYGGWGEVVINAVGDHNTNGGLNDAPPEPLSAHNNDMAYGGAGRSILIADTGGDRLIDWVGSFNTYIVPFSPFGAFTISRQNSPHLRTFLVDMAGFDGSDMRLGALYGELGMVTQQDPYWTDQTGAPSQPHPGNQGGPRDTLRGEDFSDAQTVSGSFAPDSGTWSLANERYSNTAVRDQDAVALFYVDHQLPRFFEVVAVASSDQARAGLGSNAYVIFDYQSPTDFKFAGINPANNQLAIGRRTASGWQVLADANMQLQHGRDYHLLVVVDGQQVTLVVDGSTWVTYTFTSPLVDPDDPFSDVQDPLTDGMIGIGAHGATVRLNSMTVRVLAPVITSTTTEQLHAAAGYETVAGSWADAPDGYLGTAPATAAGELDAALSLRPGAMAIEPAAVLLLEVELTLQPGGIAGVAFDLDGQGRFKLVALDVTANRIVLGFRTGTGWSFEHEVALPLTAGARYRLALWLEGNVVTVRLGDVEVADLAYHSLLHEGRFGLLTIEGAAVFHSLTVATDDPSFEPAIPVLVISDVAVLEGDDGLTTVEVPVELSRPSEDEITVTYATRDGTAIAGEDYLATSGLLVFAPGQTRAYISVQVIGDLLPEPDEWFQIVLSDPVGATLGRAVGTVTILNDDFLTTVTVEATDPTASKSGPIPGTFTVSRASDGQSVLDQPLVVRLTWAGTAVWGLDYTVTVAGGSLNATGTLLTIAAGVEEAVLTVTPTTGLAGSSTVVVTIGPDAAYEVGSPSSAEIAILDDVSLPQVSVHDAVYVADGRQGWLDVVLTLDTAPTTTVRVRALTQDGTARAGTDYRAEDGWVTFSAGQTTAVFRVRILRNARPGTHFSVVLQQPDGLSIVRGTARIDLVDPAAMAQTAAAAPTSPTDERLTAAELEPLAAAAIVAWRSLVGDDPALDAVTFEISDDLPDQRLAVTRGTHIVLSATAAGWGWYVDPDPDTPSAFEPAGDGTWRAIAGGPADGRMDLWSVLLHELGHVLGFEHDSFDPATDLGRIMSAELAAGERHTFEPPSTETVRVERCSSVSCDALAGSSRSAAASSPPAAPRLRPNPNPTPPPRPVPPATSRSLRSSPSSSSTSTGSRPSAPSPTRPEPTSPTPTSSSWHSSSVDRGSSSSAATPSAPSRSSVSAWTASRVLAASLTQSLDRCAPRCSAVTSRSLRSSTSNPATISPRSRSPRRAVPPSG
jgi:hypothetical protein